MENLKDKRVAIYMRVSTQEQSTELQAREISAYARARGWENVTIYEDQGTGTNANRPQLKLLLNNARQRKVDLVICWKLDRFFRSLKDLVVTLQEFTELGIDFISIKDNIDLTTSSGRLMMHLLGAFAEFEASLIRERVRAGLSNAKAKGKRLGRPSVIDGAKVVQLKAEGRSLSEIAGILGVTKGGVSKTLKKLGRGSRLNEQS